MHNIKWAIANTNDDETDGQIAAFNDLVDHLSLVMDLAISQNE